MKKISNSYILYSQLIHTLFFNLLTGEHDLIKYIKIDILFNNKLIFNLVTFVFEILNHPLQVKRLIIELNSDITKRNTFYFTVKVTFIV